MEHVRNQCAVLSNIPEESRHRQWCDEDLGAKTHHRQWSNESVHEDVVLLAEHQAATAATAIEEYTATAQNPDDKLQMVSQLWLQHGWAGAAWDFALVEQALALATLAKDAYWKARAFHRAVSCDLYYKGYTERAELLHEALAMLKELGEDTAYYDATRTLANYYQRVGEQAKALRLALDAAAYYERVGDGVAEAYSLSVASVVYRNIGDLGQSLASAWRMAELGKGLGLPYIEALAQSRLTSAYNDMKDYHKALECNHRIEAIYDAIGFKDVVRRALLRRNMGTNYLNLEMPEQALQCFGQALQLFRDNGHCDGEMGVLQDIAALYTMQGKNHEALRYFKQAEALLHATSQSPRRRAYLYHNMAGFYNAQGESTAEIECLEKALAATREWGSATMEYKTLLHASRAYEQAGDMERAFAYYKRYAALQQEVQASEKQRVLAEMQTRFDVERLEREREVQQLRADHLQQEMEYKNKELTLLALQLVQKNECLSRLKEHIQVMKAPWTKAQMTILRLVQESLQPENDWQMFAQQFQLIHQNFHSTLLKTCPTLTPTEMKICSLLKVGLVSKDIANILFTSVRTVETHRNTIRKKLGIPSNTSLAAHIGGL